MTWEGTLCAQAKPSSKCCQVLGCHMLSIARYLNTVFCAAKTPVVFCSFSCRFYVGCGRLYFVLLFLCCGCQVGVDFSGILCLLIAVVFRCSCSSADE